MMLNVSDILLLMSRCRNKSNINTSIASLDNNSECSTLLLANPLIEQVVLCLKIAMGLEYEDLMMSST